MNLARTWPYPIYAVLAVAILWIGHLTNPSVGSIPDGLFIVAFGLWQLRDIRQGVAHTIMGPTVQKANSPLQFWSLHIIFQAMVAVALFLPWIEKIGS